MDMPGTKLRSFEAHGVLFELDEASVTLRRAGRIVYPVPAQKAVSGRWTNKMFRLLCRFVANGRLTNRDVSYASVSQLRGLLGDTGKRVCITNIAGIGYDWALADCDADVESELRRGRPDVSEGIPVAADSPRNSHQADTNLPSTRALQELATIARQNCTPAQCDAIDIAVQMCLDPMSDGLTGRIPVGGKEAGYFERLFHRINQLDHPPEKIKSFIRLVAIDPADLPSKSWFNTVYEEISDAVRQNKLVIQYIFLLRDANVTPDVRDFLSLYEQFAEKISIVSQQDVRLAPESLRPSVVILERQKIAFTHDRFDDGTMIDATEWLFPTDVERLKAQYRRIELLSRCIFTRRNSIESGRRRARILAK